MLLTRKNTQSLRDIYQKTLNPTIQILETQLQELQDQKTRQVMHEIINENTIVNNISKPKKRTLTDITQNEIEKLKSEKSDLSQKNQQLKDRLTKLENSAFEKTGPFSANSLKETPGLINCSLCIIFS